MTHYQYSNSVCQYSFLALSMSFKKFGWGKHKLECRNQNGTEKEPTEGWQGQHLNHVIFAPWLCELNIQILYLKMYLSLVDKYKYHNHGNMVEEVYRAKKSSHFFHTTCIVLVVLSFRYFMVLMTLSILVQNHT